MRGGIKENAYAFFAGGDSRPYEVKAKKRVLSFLHYNKTNPVNGYISRFTGLCCVKYKPRERIFVRVWGLSFKIFDCLQIYFGTIICLSTNTQCRFFYAKTYRFPRRFSHISRRGGNLPPAKTAKPFSLILPRPARNTIAALPR